MSLWEAFILAGQIAAWAMLYGSLLGFVVLMSFLVQYGPKQPETWR